LAVVVSGRFGSDDGAGIAVFGLGVEFAPVGGTNTAAFAVSLAKGTGDDGALLLQPKKFSTVVDCSVFVKGEVGTVAIVAALAVLAVATGCIGGSGAGADFFVLVEAVVAVAVALF
jgi:hypothetical protein